MTTQGKKQNTMEGKRDRNEGKVRGAKGEIKIIEEIQNKMKTWVMSVCTH